jgi:superfamily I DNA/RNA helicase
MGIRLPSYQELTPDEQVRVLNLPLNKTYIVIGGPGTGKTILALQRAKMVQATNPEADVKFLIFNRLLRQYLNLAISQLELEEVADATTWHTWFYGYYKKLTGKGAVPQVANFRPDWDVIMPEISPLLKNKIWDHLILDEAQDFPPELLEVLNSVTVQSTVFGDSQQRISLSSTVDFTAIFNNGAPLQGGKNVFYLTKNHRNSKEIAAVSSLFYSGSPDDLPAQPRRTGPKPTWYIGEQDALLDQIAITADNRPESTIGVLVPIRSINPLRQEIALLKSITRELDSRTKRASVEMYISWKDEGDFSLDNPGIKVLSYSTAKGLEFDLVYMPHIDRRIFKLPTDNQTLATAIINQVYVASSRAREELYFQSPTVELSSFIIEKLQANLDLIEVEALS